MTEAEVLEFLELKGMHWLISAIYSGDLDSFDKCNYIVQVSALRNKFTDEQFLEVIKRLAAD